jgi:lipoyl-dependent peroxiredoxin
MKTFYTAEVTASGGRAGHARSSDGVLDVPLSLPASMGGDGKKTNPEQLFAAGYAACFEHAVIHVASQGKTPLSNTQVTAKVGMGQHDDGPFGLEVSLEVKAEGLSGDELEAVVKEADRLCPYSNAVRGNIPVKITVV